MGATNSDNKSRDFNQYTRISGNSLGIQRDRIAAVEGKTTSTGFDQVFLRTDDCLCFVDCPFPGIRRQCGILDKDIGALALNGAGQLCRLRVDVLSGQPNGKDDAASC